MLEIADPIKLAAPFLIWLDYLGVAIFAASGALAAARMNQTFVTFTFFAFATGVGGGTVRDLLIDAPVFWMGEKYLLAAILGAALLIWFIPARWKIEKWLATLDGLGLAIYSVYGTSKAISYGVPPLSAIVMGIFTASLGGIIRDILANQPSIIMRPELYISASALASTSYVILTEFGMLTWWAAIIAGASGFLLRFAGIKWGWSLPQYKNINSEKQQAKSDPHKD